MLVVDTSPACPYHSGMKILKHLLGAAILSALLFSCGSKDLPEGAVAVVNKTTITEEEFNQELDMFKGQYESQGMAISEADLAMIKPQLLDSLVIKVLLLEKVEDLKITPDAEGIAAQMDGFRQQFGSEEDFQEALKASGYTEDKLTSDLEEQSVVQQLFDAEVYSDISVTEEDMLAFYEENKETAFQIPESVEASHILIQVSDEQTEEDALAKILDIKKEIDGGLDFGEAAIQYSEGPSSSQKGYLGQFGRGQMVPEFEAVAFDQEIGTVSDPVLTQFGYHLILTSAKSPSETMSYDDSKQYIESQMNQDARNNGTMEYIEALKKKAKILIPDWAQTEEEALS